MNCIIVEDQPPAQRILKKYIENIGTLQLEATFSDPIQAMAFLKTEAVDLMFLDIHLPKISGLDFLKSIIHPPQVILTTAFSDYALESYEFNVVDYLLKPFSFQRFVKAVAKIQEKTPQETTPTVNLSPPGAERKSLFIKSGYEWVKINADEILYIKSDADYTEIVLPKKKYLSGESLRHWEETLDPSQFIRIHKSYIIHLEKIEKVAGNRAYLNASTAIPIGRAYKDDFLDKIL